MGTYVRGNINLNGGDFISQDKITVNVNKPTPIFKLVETCLGCGAILDKNKAQCEHCKNPNPLFDVNSVKIELNADGDFVGNGKHIDGNLNITGDFIGGHKQTKSSTVKVSW